MAKYELTADKDGNVAFLMRAGKDLVRNKMPLKMAQATVANGKVTEGITDFPIGVDDTYFFAGKEIKTAPTTKGKTK